MEVSKRAVQSWENNVRPIKKTTESLVRAVAFKHGHTIDTQSESSEVSHPIAYYGGDMQIFSLIQRAKDGDASAWPEIESTIQALVNQKNELKYKLEMVKKIFE